MRKAEKMAVQWQPRIIIPVVLSLVFVMGFLFGNMGKTCPEYTRVIAKEEAALYAQGKSSGQAAPEKSEAAEEIVYVDLSEEIPTLPSIAKTTDKLLHEPVSCTKMDNFKPTFVFFMFSVAERYDRRKAIRETWGKYLRAECGLRLIFVLGVIEANEESRVKNVKLQQEVDKEAEEHKDVLQFGQLIDGSRTLTKKAKLTFEWFLRECPTAEYIVKGEDHTWIHPSELFRFVLENPPDAIFGHRVYIGSPVFRDPKSYFYVSRDDYKEDTYPEYMISMAYVIPKPVLVTLLEKAKEVHEIPLEDVYWTGMVADYAKIPRRNTEGYEYDYLIDKGHNVKCAKRQLTAVRYMPPTEFYKYEADTCHTYAQCIPSDKQVPAVGVPVGRR